MNPPTLNRCVFWFATALAMHWWLAATAADAAQATHAQANCVAEVALTMEKSYANPFMDVTLDALVTAPDGRRFLLLQNVDRQEETVMIYNWADELRKLWR